MTKQIFKSIPLDGETADRIAVDVLKQHRESMLSDLGAKEVGETYLHPEDVIQYEKCSRYIAYLLKNYFGERV
jgi:hypothetical protein